jgi:hypothetical protein
MHVLTSSDVPSQARACNMPTMSLLLGAAFRKTVGRSLPLELAQLILGETDGIEFGMSREEAERRRRALMADRKVQGGKVNDVSALSRLRLHVFRLMWPVCSYGRRVILTHCASIDEYECERC